MLISNIYKKIFHLFLTTLFGINILIPMPCFAQANNQFLPEAGELIFTSEPFQPLLLRGVRVNGKKPFELEFFMDSGDVQSTPENLKETGMTLIKYFLASVTTPDSDMWVNLSPYEKDRIIPNEFGQTEMGRDMLAQDYLLKQLSATLMHPEKELGEKFWDRVYAETQKRFHTSNLAVDTFNKVWIIPESADVYENGGTAYILKSRLKVMLEEDYLALQKSLDTKDKNFDSKNQIATEILREIIVPAIEQEVNDGENFAKLRQIYHSMILATWYKDRIKESLLSHMYADQKKIPGIDVDNKQIKEEIYQQYLQAFKVGVYNYIKEDYDPQTQEVVPRKYFSGGTTWNGMKTKIVYHQSLTNETLDIPESDFALITRLDNTAPETLLENFDAAMATQYTEKQWIQINETHDALGLVAKNIKEQIENTGMDVLFADIDAWLNENPDDAFIQIMGLKDEEVKEQAFAPMLEKLQKFVLELQIIQPLLLEKIEGQLESMKAASLIQFSDKGKIQPANTEELLSEIKKGIEPLQKMLNWWNKFSDEQGNIDKMRFVFFVEQWQITLKAYQKYASFLQHAQDISLFDISEISDNVSNQGHPRNIYDHFLIPYQNALLIREKKGFATETATGYTDAEWKAIEDTYALLRDLSQNLTKKMQDNGFITLAEDIQQWINQNPNQIFANLESLPAAEKEKQYSELIATMNSFATKIENYRDDYLAEVNNQREILDGKTLVIFNSDREINPSNTAELLYDIQDKIGKLSHPAPEYWKMFYTDGIFEDNFFSMMVSEFEDFLGLFKKYHDYLKDIQHPELIQDQNIADNSESLSQPQFGYEQFLVPYRDALAKKKTNENPSLESPPQDSQNDQQEMISPIDESQDMALATNLKKGPEDEKVGGVDFNRANLNLRIQRDDQGMPLPFEMQPMYDLEIYGLTPVIIDIMPVTNIQSLLQG